MAIDNKTITLWELPEISEINDSDIFIIADGNITHKITGENLILYIKNHDDISKYFVHQDVVDAANGVASLDGNQKLHSENIPFGIQSGSVYEGSSGKALEDALDSHLIDKDNPHSVTKAQINLGNVDNTADINKPVSHAQQAAIDASCTEAKTYANTIVNNLIDGAPETMNTLNEIAEVFKEHQEVSDALNSAIGTKIDKTAFDTHVTDNNVHVTSSEKSNWNDSNTKKHIHSNKSVLDGITTALITAWNNAVTHISDNVKHVTSNERTLWNTVTDKVAKVDGKSLSSNDYSDSDRTKLQGIENGANKYQHPTSDGSKHVPANGITNGGKYLKASSIAGNYEWGTLTKDDVEAALGYTPSESEGVTYRLSKSGSNIILTGSDGSRNSITDSDTTYTLSDFGITASSAEINHLKGTASNIQTQINNVYTKSETTTLLNDKLAKAGDGSNLTTAFTEAPTLETINTGEKLSVIMGKVKKAITALISHTGTAATSSVLGHVKVDSALNTTSTNPVQNKTINTALAGKLATTGNASNTTVAYTEATALTELASGEKQSVAFGKLKLAVKNVISIVKLLGSTDISAIGGGTVTGAISSLNSNLMYETTGFKGVLTATEINDASIVVSYTGDINPATADELGLAPGWWAIAHMAHVSGDGYCAQAVYPYTAADVPRYRNCYAGTWSKWSAIGDGWIDLTPQCTFYVALQPSPAFGSWIKYNISTRELKGVIETTSDIKNQQIIVNFPAQLPGLCGINTFTGICGVAVNGINNTDPYLRIMPRVQGGAIISSHTRDEIVHGATYMISFIAQC